MRTDDTRKRFGSVVSVVKLAGPSFLLAAVLEIAYVGLSVITICLEIDVSAMSSHDEMGQILLLIYPIKVVPFVRALYEDRNTKAIGRGDGLVNDEEGETVSTAEFAIVVRPTTRVFISGFSRDGEIRGFDHAVILIIGHSPPGP
jgi:hypothetical protein